MEFTLTDNIDGLENYWALQGTTEVRCHLVTPIGDNVCEYTDPNIVKVTSTTALIYAGTEL